MIARCDLVERPRVASHDELEAAWLEFTCVQFPLLVPFGPADGLRCALATNRDVRIVVLKANGRAFCAGLDLNAGDFGGVDRTPQGTLGVQKRIADIYRAMRRCPQPISPHGPNGRG